MINKPQHENLSPESMITDSEVASYRQEGYLIVRSVFSFQEIVELVAACNELQTMGASYEKDTFAGAAFFNVFRDANPFASNIEQIAQVPGKIRRVTYPYAVSSILNRFRTHQRLLGTVTPILGNSIKQIVNQVNFHFPKSSSGWGWHQDYRFRKPGISDLARNFVQSIIAIDPCNSNTGGLRLIPRSHELGDLKLDINNEKAETFFDVKTAITPDLAPGDVILFNSHVIHGSQANTSNNIRRVYINGYAHGSSTIGIPVVENGAIISDIRGHMEYENDRESLPKASKY